MTTSLIFVYQGESGLFNTLSHVAHKIFSPQTYPCNLCNLINSPLGMRSEWKQFLSSLNMPFEFLHEDEYTNLYKTTVKSAPVVLSKLGESIDVLVSTEVINQCKTIDELKHIILSKLTLHKPLVVSC
jgi:hypothetical protein